MSSLQRVDELNILTRAKYPIIYIVSWEERRIEDMLRQVAIDRRKKLYGWTLTDGITRLFMVGTVFAGLAFLATFALQELELQRDEFFSGQGDTARPFE